MLFARDLDQFETLLAENSDLRRLVRSPVFAAEVQSRALGAVLDKAGISGLAANFLKLVASNRRLFAVARHDPRLQGARRQAQGRGHRAR